MDAVAGPENMIRDLASGTAIRPLVEWATQGRPETGGVEIDLKRAWAVLGM